MYLGLDLGTSGIKALIIDDNQKIITAADSPLSVTRPGPGWSEQDPADWIAATETALLSLKTSHPKQLAAVKGIGFSGQMHGATLLDKSDKVLRPCMLWNDTRSHVEAAELDADPKFRALSGNIVFPGFTAPKVEWVRRNETGIFDQTAKILLPKDYLRLWLTGDHVSEMSDAAGTSWLDVEKRCWSPELLGACHLDESHMPSLVEGSEVSGQLRSDLAQQWGMGNVVVAGGAGDNAASAIGLGVVQAGSAFVSLGTSGVLFASNASYLPNPESAVHTFCHAVPDTWHQMGVFLSATDSLNWWAGICGTSAADLTGELGTELQSPSGITFLPYLSGERTPHNDAKIRGAFLGLDHGHDRKQMTRAVLEGVAFALRDSLEALAAAGTNLERVMAVGGGTRSTYWLELVASVLNLPLDLPQDGDFGAAFGAARLGLIAAEEANAESVCTPPSIARSFEPNAVHVDQLATAYQTYRDAYPAISGVG
ncbi:MAG: xylulokinase [Rhizobiaceae bacterium]|nr:xylulokinase [Rhizobiaceae bacterium]